MNNGNGGITVERPLRKILIGLVLISIASGVSSRVSLADDRSPTLSAPAPKPPPDLAKRVQEITDAVLEHHIDPPARQQMILSGIKALYRAAGVPVPAGLGRRVSAIATPDQLAELLAEVWPKATAKPVAASDLEETLFDGLLAAVPAGGQLISAKERKVAEQFEGNRYVGIHIALGMNEKEKQPNLHEVFPGGPADRAGVKKDDLIEEIDGVATKGEKLRDIVDRLRGEEGTDVTIKVRQPNETKSRTFKITRGALPRETVHGVRQRSAGGWDVRLNRSEPIGYLTITEITASTPHELRKLARQLEARASGHWCSTCAAREAARSIRPCSWSTPCWIMVGSAASARLEARRSMRPIPTPSSAAGRWPYSSTSARRAPRNGLRRHSRTTNGRRSSAHATAGTEFGRPEMEGIRSRVAIGDGSWSIELMTGYLERGDGRPLVVLSEDTIDFRPRHLLARRAESGQTEEIKTGVTPDLMAGPNPTVRGMLAQRRKSSPTPQPAPKSDEALEKAIQWLERSLKKS